MNNVCYRKPVVKNSKIKLSGHKGLWPKTPDTVIELLKNVDDRHKNLC